MRVRIGAAQQRHAIELENTNAISQPPSDLRKERQLDWDTYYLRHENKHGIWRIQKRQGRFHVYFEDENLGSYAYPIPAFEELLGGSTFWPSCGDPSECELPDDPEDWDKTPLSRLPR